jgi:hypothetical protein
MMFALMAPVIVTGAWAERMEFGAFLMYVTVTSPWRPRRCRLTSNASPTLLRLSTPPSRA